ncbi:MAG: hypothetical protein MJ252_13175 [archaeon]|nr:hypothetical protein [archaeon]
MGGNYNNPQMQFNQQNHPMQQPQFMPQNQFQSNTSQFQPNQPKVMGINEYLSGNQRNNPQPQNIPNQGGNQNLSYKEKFVEHLKYLFVKCKSVDQAKPLFQTLHTIINKITKNPNDKKYQKINITKLLQKFPYDDLVPLFKFIGFTQIEDFMHLSVEPSKLGEILPELNQFIKEKNLAESTFNPYQSSFASLSNDNEKIKNAGVEDFADLYQKEILRREEIIKKAEIQRNPKCYELNQNLTINNVINSMNNSDDTSLISNSEEDQAVLRRAMALIQKKQNDRFTLKSRTKYENLMKTPVYIKSDIRLKFPDSHILEGSFTLCEKIGDVYNFVKEYLKNPNMPFVLSTSPPPKKYQNMNETLNSLKLYPQVLMYVGCDNFEGLNEEKIATIKGDINMEENIF